MISEIYEQSGYFVESLERQGYDKVRKALVWSVLEKTLLDIGIYCKVIDELKKRYCCHLDDCYDHPEYLNAILKDLHGDSYKHVIKSINKQLEEFSYHGPITRFLKVISQ
ncbi:MAG TPA: hypothetical protein VGR54_09380 [Nitrosopumilaceae archaeon]|nr:hypothetical protein [Nitrosopumilaceae archaeon]